MLRICVSLAPARPGYFFIYLGGRNAITKIFERATTKILCRAKKRQKEQKTVCKKEQGSNPHPPHLQANAANLGTNWKLDELYIGMKGKKVYLLI